jgi:DNA primase
MNVDFRSLRTIPIESVCAMLGIQLKRRGSQLRSQCPICRHPSTRAFSVTPQMSRWWCHGTCKAGGDGLELIVRMKRVSHAEGAKILVERFGEPH